VRHPLDDDGGGERQLLARALEELFPDDLGGPVRLGRRGEEILRVCSGSLGEVRREEVREALDPVARLRRDRHDLTEEPGRGELRDHRQQSFLGHEIDLVEGKKGGSTGPGEQIEDAPLLSALGRVDDQENEVRGGKRVRRVPQHDGVHPVIGAVDSRSVHERDLGARTARDPENAFPRRLRLIGNDRDFLADEPVHERRLARVRTPDDRHLARAEDGLAGNRNWGTGNPGILVRQGSRWTGTATGSMRTR
jgi:hypothetical protein